MIDMRKTLHVARFAAVLAAALAISACAKNAEDAQANAAGQATPGSQQDFVVNVGDRVFFETDSSELTTQARATLDKQAQWLTNYSQYSQFTVEGHADERGTREYTSRLAPGAPRQCATIWCPAASRRNACGRSHSGRSARSPSVTIFRAGRRTGAPSPCSVSVHSALGETSGGGTAALGAAVALLPARNVAHVRKMMGDAFMAIDTSFFAREQEASVCFHGAWALPCDIH
jgi:hypothetical protein